MQKNASLLAIVAVDTAENKRSEFAVRKEGKLMGQSPGKSVWVCSWHVTALIAAQSQAQLDEAPSALISLETCKLWGPT